MKKLLLAIALLGIGSTTLIQSNIQQIRQALEQANEKLKKVSQSEIGKTALSKARYQAQLERAQEEVEKASKKLLNATQRIMN